MTANHATAFVDLLQYVTVTVCLSSSLSCHCGMHDNIHSHCGTYAYINALWGFCAFGRQIHHSAECKLVYKLGRRGFCATSLANGSSNGMMTGACKTKLPCNACATNKFSRYRISCCDSQNVRSVGLVQRVVICIIVMLTCSRCKFKRSHFAVHVIINQLLRLRWYHTLQSW